MLYRRSLIDYPDRVHIPSVRMPEVNRGEADETSKLLESGGHNHDHVDEDPVDCVEGPVNAVPPEIRFLGVTITCVVLLAH